MCPECESTSLSANRIGIDEIEITCMNCGATFKPGEGITAYKVKEHGIGVIVAGYSFAVLCILLLPIIFLPLAIICGLICIVDGYYRIIHGVIIIILAFTLANHGAKIGGWGFGISYDNIHFK